MAGTFPSPFLFQGWSWLGKLTSGKSNYLWPVHGKKARRGLEEGWKKSLQTQTSKYFERRRQNQLAWKAGSRTCRWSFKRTRQISVDIEEGRFHPKTTWPEEKVPQNGQKSWEWRWGKMAQDWWWEQPEYPEIGPGFPESERWMAVFRKIVFSLDPEFSFMSKGKAEIKHIQNPQVKTRGPTCWCTIKRLFICVRKLYKFTQLIVRLNKKLF